MGVWLLTQVQPAILIDVDDGTPLSVAGIEGVPYYGEDTHAGFPSRGCMVDRWHQPAWKSGGGAL